MLFGDHVRPILVGFTLAFLALMLFAGAANAQSVGFYALACGGAAAHFVWQFATWEVEVPADGGRKFQANGCTGLVIWAGVLADYLLSIQSASA